MSDCTEITNFAASAWSLEVLDTYALSDADKGEIIRNLAAYGPAINEEN